MIFNMLSTSRVVSAFSASCVAVALLLALAPGCNGEIMLVNSAEASGSGGASSGTSSVECGPPSADCNGDPTDGCEIDLSSDPANCGKCNVDCGGGVCSSGVCPEAPVVLAHGKNPVKLELNSTGVFFVDYTEGSTDFAIYRVAKDGSSFGPVTPASPFLPRGLAVNETSVFWTEYGDYYCQDWCSDLGRVFSAPIKGGAPKSLVDTPKARPDQVVIDDTHVYWIESPQIRRIPIGGGEAETLVADDVFRFDLVIDKMRLFWTPLDVNENVVMSADKSGAGQGPLCATSSKAFGLTQDDSWIYWGSALDPNPYGGPMRIERISALGGSSSVVVSNMPGSYFAVHKGFVYWSESKPGRVLRVPVSGGSPEVLAAGLGLPEEIAVDDSGIYWLHYSDDDWPEVMRLPLPLMDHRLLLRDTQVLLHFAHFGPTIPLGCKAK